jgi:flagellar biosynthesis protein
MPIVAENRQSAVALRYADADAAPVVVAKGKGALAEEIIRRAREAGVFVHESRELVTLLMQVDLDARIPPALYLAVAELLAWVYGLEARQSGADDRAAGAPLPRPPAAARGTSP